MPTITIAELEELLKGLGLQTPIPQFASSQVLSKPLDLCRSYLANLLCGLVDCNPASAYSAVQLSGDPLHGDLTVVLPRLRPGSKAGELADDILDKVCVPVVFDILLFHSYH
jgi:arginyl-tRNA synthetase